MKVKLEVSARHMHISQEHLEVLFGEGYTLEKHVKDLSQPGMVSCPLPEPMAGSCRTQE